MSPTDPNYGHPMDSGTSIIASVADPNPKHATPQEGGGVRDRLDLALKMQTAAAVDGLGQSRYSTVQRGGHPLVCIGCADVLVGRTRNMDKGLRGGPDPVLYNCLTLTSWSAHENPHWR